MSAVDVVVPCYNYGRYLRQCVESVISQRDVNVRVLIIDDASSDDSAAIGAEVAASDARVTFRRHERNQGHIKTFNEGIIDWASAKYTLLISADDGLAPGALARATRIMDDHDEVGMTYGLAQAMVDGGGPIEIEDVAKFDYQILSGCRYLRHSCEHGNQVPSPTAVIRTELQHQVGGYHPGMLHTSDMEMWMRLATRSSIGVVNAVQAFYRWHGRNMSSQYIAGPLSDRRELISTCKEVLEGWGAQTPGLKGWVDAMRRRYAREAYWLAGVAVERGDQEGVRLCLDFAAEHDPAPWRSSERWRFLAKRAIGPGLLGKVRAVSGGNQCQANGSTSDPAPTIFQHGQRFGWWPCPSEEGASAQLFGGS